MAKYNVLARDEYKADGCFNTLYYYSYFPLTPKYTAAIFAYSVCSCCGDEQMLLAVLDNDGNIVSAIKAAEVKQASECTITTITKLTGSDLLICQKEECGIIEGRNQGYSSVDSVTIRYNLSATGKISLLKRDSVSLVR